MGSALVSGQSRELAELEPCRVSEVVEVELRDGQPSTQSENAP